jgi:hypothetical protein
MQLGSAVDLLTGILDGGRSAGTNAPAGFADPAGGKIRRQIKN